MELVEEMVKEDNKRIKIGCNGLIIKKNEILLGLRTNCYGEGNYGIPGGHLEYGETIENAVKRELEEELGIKVLKLSFNSIIDEPRENEHYIQINFLIEEYRGKVEIKEPHKCKEVRWFDINNLPSNLFIPHQAIMIAYIKRMHYLPAE